MIPRRAESARDGPMTEPLPLVATQHVVDVNECHVFAVSGPTAEWWARWRGQHERNGRITVLTPSIAGDAVRVACTNRKHADWLAAHLVDHGGLPRTAVKAKTLRPPLRPVQSWWPE